MENTRITKYSLTREKKIKYGKDANKKKSW